MRIRRNNVATSMRYHLPLVLPGAQLLVCVLVLWPIRGRLLCGRYDSTQFYTAILHIRNGLAGRNER
jgi:hypothetical protein